MKTKRDQFIEGFLMSIFLVLVIPILVNAQENINSSDKRQEIYTLVDQYLEARDTKDTVLLQSILTTDIDQLVSSGEWRMGIDVCVNGMMRSSTNNPGNRKIEIDKIRMLSPEVGIADARYEITNADGRIRKMWSTFIVVNDEKGWKITAIRNMRYGGS
jgi:competence protein ComGC